MQLDKLDKCRDLRLRVQSLDDKLEILHAAAERTTTRLTGLPRGTAWHDPLPGYVDAAKDLGDEYAAEALALLRMVLEVSKYLSRLPPDYERVMRLRYFDSNRTWSDVAKAAHLSEDRCKAINTVARKMLEEMC